MNCRAAQRSLSAERDGALAAEERAAFEAHLADCADCRQARAAVSAAVDHWHAAAARVAVPDAERAWQDIHREIRIGAPEKTHAIPGARRWAFSMAAAALICAAMFAPRWLENSAPRPPQVARLEKARADFVEVGNNSSSVVYVDDKSGWLVVWAVNDQL